MPRLIAAAPRDRHHSREQQEQDRRREQHGVHAVEHPAVPGQDAAGVLDPGAALDHRFDQIAHLRRHRRDRSGGEQDGQSRAGRIGQKCSRTMVATTPVRKPASGAFPRSSFGLTTGASLCRPRVFPT